MSNIYIYASSNYAIIGSDNDLSPDRRQAIIETNADEWSIGRLGKYFSEKESICASSWMTVHQSKFIHTPLLLCMGRQLHVIERYGMK